MYTDEERAGSRVMHPMPPEFVTFVPYACYQLQSPFEVRVNVEWQDQYCGLEEKKKGKRTGQSQRHLAHTATRRALAEPSASGLELGQVPTTHKLAAEEGVVVVHAVMDFAGNLMEIAFRRCVTIPRMLIQVMGWSVPHHDLLSRLTIRWAALDAIALYEFSKFLSNVNLTEICLDDSPVKGRNYEVLLAGPSRLRYLSLARCSLDDADVASLASHLEHPRPAAATLAVLLLAANRIGDAGAAALAHALRTNRTLRCLNLAGNAISDVGAITIFNTLMEFPLTADEILKKRSRVLDFLKMKSELYERCVRQLVLDKSHDEIRSNKRRMTVRPSTRRNSMRATHSNNALLQKAEAMATELMGVFTDPFSIEQTVTRSGYTYCIGNTSLCWLSLAYNNLEYSSLGALYEVLAHQHWLGARATPGLLQVNVDGNQLPVDCDHLFLIEDLLDKARCSKTKTIKQVIEKLRPGRVRSLS
ncbi:uncharacterized protein LOC118265367 [Spodoptera frugiperda]|uniref:Uncharacterized protein LOC118265367 n=1 Tax=Spodoptera frugiperda TaxID=7108 RepID=A0A9R0EH60_SPOFR|nr:uncharacterized protein LOC118265367 [Spodoptera frugiperda]